MDERKIDGQHLIGREELYARIEKYFAYRGDQEEKRAIMKMVKRCSPYNYCKHCGGWLGPRILDL